MKTFVYLYFISFSVALFLVSACCSNEKCNSTSYKDEYVEYSKRIVPDSYKKELEKECEKLLKEYDYKEHMMTMYIHTWNYHTDKVHVTYHHVMRTLKLVSAMLDSGNPKYLPEAEKALEAVIDLQEKDTSKKFYGVWPYHKEERVYLKKTRPDLNWALFPSGVLLDIYMNHSDVLDSQLVEKIKDAILLASKRAKERNVNLGYTNIAIMSSYVTYMAGHLFNDKDLADYSKKRFAEFYDYTMKKGGFSEYNSPNYTIIALVELTKMQNHIRDKKCREMIEVLADMQWKMIATHYHKPTHQWAGPHSRSYITLMGENGFECEGDVSVGLGEPRAVFLDYIQSATNSKVDFSRKIDWQIAKLNMKMPEKYLEYFLNPKFPKTVVNVFEPNAPKTIGVCYLTDKYAYSTINNSDTWNQRRSLLAYFKNEKGHSAYLHLRVMHDSYDFCSGKITSSQKENKSISAITFVTNGGDKHMVLDNINGFVNAKDIRVRFEMGNTSPDIKALKNGTYRIFLPEFDIIIRELRSDFDSLNCNWKISKDGNMTYLDYVIYEGDVKKIDLQNMKNAYLAFEFEIVEKNANPKEELYKISRDGSVMHIEASDLKIKFNAKPQAKGRH